MADPKILDSAEDRARAREMRDAQWAFAERVATASTLWFCWWDKDHRHKPPLPDDVFVSGLISGLEYLDWMGRHEDWWVIGKWDDRRYAAPIELTPAGRGALANRRVYDMEPVYGGMVEPGWVCTPAEVSHA